LFAQREPLYLACADYKIDTGVLQSKVVVNHILEEYKSVHR
jgi:shikimate kinase